MSRSTGGALVKSGTDGRKIHLAVSWKSLKPCEDTIRTLTDNRVDFGFHFSHFLMNLGALREETRTTLKESVNKPSAEMSFPPDISEEEKSHLRMLGFLEQKIAAFADVDSEEVEKPLASLKEAYLRYAGIGWWFPDNLYRTWVVEAEPGGRIDFSFGVSNGTGREISDIEATLEVGGNRKTQTIQSATEDVVFLFDGPAVSENPPLPGTIDLGLRFKCSGVAYSASRTVDLRVESPTTSR
jgi:hypothetical protein